MKDGPEALLNGLDTPALPEKSMPPPRPEIGKPQAFQFAQPLDLGPKLGLGARIENVEGKSALSLHRLARAEFVENGESRNFPHRGMGPRPVEMQFVLTVDLPKLVFGKAEGGSQLMKSGENIWVLP